jgi:hypothetical protein
LSRPKPSTAWWHDLALERGGLRARKTGALIPYSAANLIAISRGVANYTATQGLRLGGLLAPAPAFRIAFTPHQPQPWHLIWSVLYAAGGKIVADPQTADAVFYFEDITLRTDDPLSDWPEPARPPRQLNCACLDVSKSKVARIFEDVFGYPLSLDPTQWHGPAVEKSERNGAHDGRIVSCPCARKSGRVYERLIDNSDNGRFIEDYRAPTIGGEIALVYIKQRSINYRFANTNDQVLLRRPEQVFSTSELGLLKQFCQRMNLDWGGIDVLRDRKDGRLYVVDVNKTDMGPPTALGLIDQIRSVRQIAQCFRAYIHS